MRRDLNDLAERGYDFAPPHGGAALPSSSMNAPWHRRKATQTEEKAHRSQSRGQESNGSTLFIIDIGIAGSRSARPVRAQ
ncbi:hypothetical protein KCP76_07850 [Salmonella enterica subsp. enterica serovar Weltevreden]|nr:hypothetical protein KCP76_07850 [Salmonella enterica subsp. enterica serovar Weltevreden]